MFALAQSSSSASSKATSREQFTGGRVRGGLIALIVFFFAFGGGPLGGGSSSAAYAQVDQEEEDAEERVVVEGKEERDRRRRSQYGSYNRAARGNYPVGEGALSIGGTLGFSTYGGDLYEEGLVRGEQGEVVREQGRTHELLLSPSAAYFVAPGLAFGGEGSFLYRSQDGVSMTRFTFGPSASYYYGDEDWVVYPFVSGVAAYSQRYDDGTRLQGGFLLDGSLGIAVQVGRNVAITTEAFGIYENYERREDGETLEGNTFGLRVGISSFLY